MAELKDFAEQLVNLTVKEVNELANILKEEYGIEPAAAVEVWVLIILCRGSWKWCHSSSLSLNTFMKHI